MSFVQKIIVDSGRHQFPMTPRMARKRCSWHCNIWPDWFTSHQSHYYNYYSGILEFIGKRLMPTLKWMSESRVYWRNGKLKRLSRRFHTVIDTVQNLGLPDHAGELTALTQCFRKVTIKCHWLGHDWYTILYQEPITLSEQLPCARVMEFSWTSLFLEWFWCKFWISFKCHKPGSKTYRPKNDVFCLLITFSFLFDIL